jgi:23S rRNA (guanosine2251-2'-O)-methyltransferase
MSGLKVGINPVDAALSHEAEQVDALLVERGTRNGRVRGLMERARGRKIAVREVDCDELDRLAEGVRHQGVIARMKAAARRAAATLEEALESLAPDALFLILDGVTDPHNLGACLRSAEAAGVAAVIVPRDRAVGITPVVEKSSAGAASRIAFIQVTNLARAMEQLKAANIWITGLAGEGTASLYDIDFRGPCAIAMGSEGDGLRRLTAEHCDHLVKIPMRGQVESLNVSVATGIALFEVLRQRGAGKR